MLIQESSNSPDLPQSPSDPRPRGFNVQLALPESGELVAARVDTYSDRLRCDHPQTRDGLGLGEALKAEAKHHGLGLVVVFAPSEVAIGLRQGGFHCDATMPRFYWDQGDCWVLSCALDSKRAITALEEEVGLVNRLVASSGGRSERRTTREVIQRAGREDAAQIASLISQTFSEYPTPSGIPSYIEQAILDGIPFRVIKERGEIVACASADLVPQAGAAELTDCATRPECRGRGYMQAILSALMEDLRALKYPTAFTLARARIPGVNLAFRRLDFELRGRMTRSCRIGEGLEDMNVWIRSLQA